MQEWTLIILSILMGFGVVGDFLLFGNGHQALSNQGMHDKLVSIANRFISMRFFSCIIISNSCRGLLSKMQGLVY